MWTINSVGTRLSNEEDKGGSQFSTGQTQPSKEELRQGFKSLRRLQTTTLFYQIGATILLGALMGGSQAMKTEWLENMLAIIPAASVLLTWNTENRSHDNKRPFGYHRTGTLAFMAASFALAAVGTYLFYDSLTKLIRNADVLTREELELEAE